MRVRFKYGAVGEVDLTDVEYDQLAVFVSRGMLVSIPFRHEKQTFFVNFTELKRIEGTNVDYSQYEKFGQATFAR
jgi:hypothetical protein